MALLPGVSTVASPGSIPVSKLRLTRKPWARPAVKKLTDRISTAPDHLAQAIPASSDGRHATRRRRRINIRSIAHLLQSVGWLQEMPQELAQHGNHRTGGPTLLRPEGHLASAPAPHTPGLPQD